MFFYITSVPFDAWPEEKQAIAKKYETVQLNPKDNPIWDELAYHLKEEHRGVVETILSREIGRCVTVYWIGDNCFRAAIGPYNEYTMYRIMKRLRKEL